MSSLREPTLKKRLHIYTVWYSSLGHNLNSPGLVCVFVFSVDLVCKEELNLIPFAKRCW